MENEATILTILDDDSLDGKVLGYLINHADNES